VVPWDGAQRRLTDWQQFVQLVNARFGPPLTNDPIGELAMLQHMGGVDEYSKCLITLSYRGTTLSEPQQY
jgi:hypothetical protein